MVMFGNFLDILFSNSCVNVDSTLDKFLHEFNYGDTLTRENISDNKVVTLDPRGQSQCL